jgi:thymidine kinase
MKDGLDSRKAYCHNCGERAFRLEFYRDESHTIDDERESIHPLACLFAKRRIR